MDQETTPVNETPNMKPARYHAILADGTIISRRFSRELTKVLQSVDPTTVRTVIKGKKLALSTNVQIRF